MDESERDFQDLGVTVFAGVVPQSALQSINAMIDATRHQWQPADGRRESKLALMFVELLRKSDAFRATEAKACEASQRWATQKFGRTPALNRLYVLRCVNRDTPSQSHLRHFDSHVLTLLIPLRLAQPGEQNGDLVMYRKQRSSISLVHNVVTKAALVVQQHLPFRTRLALIRRDMLSKRCVRVTCEPGNVYGFNGFITMHANLAIDAGERRSLIIHYYDPGLTAGVRSAARAVRSLSDRLKYRTHARLTRHR
jgi:hypothetical protein